MPRTLYFGLRYSPAGRMPFGIADGERFRHTYAIGASGTGKSTLLHNLFAQEILAGEGCGLIDPHGDLARAALSLVPRRRTSDTILIDLADAAHPAAFNPLYRVPADERPLVAANLVAAFKHIWRDSWGPRLEYILTNALLLLLDAPDRARPTLLALPRLLTDAAYRNWLLRHAQDARVRAFWRDEFSGYSERLRAEALSPIQNKIGAFLASPAVRNVIGQWRTRIDFADMLDRRGILIVNLARGQVGGEPASLMGALIVAMIQAAAMARIKKPEHERAGFHLVIDEFAYVTSSAFIDILAESRKVKLAVTLAHQHLAQLDEDVAAAVLANTGTVAAFRVSAEDARRIAAAVGDIIPTALTDLTLGEAWMRVSPPGTVATSHHIKTFPAIHGSPERAAQLTAAARARLAYPRADVEARLNSWLAGPARL